MSPRGTYYDQGVVSAGNKVYVMLGPDGTVLNYRMPDNLNLKQQAAILALINSPENTVARDQVLAHYPFIVEVAEGWGVGKLYQGLNAGLSRIRYPQGIARGNFVLIQNEQDYEVLPYNSRGAPILGQIAVFQASVNPYAEKGAFQYQLVQGNFPPEVVRFLEFTRQRMEDPNAGL
jgi:hypothetical protein